MVHSVGEESEARPNFSEAARRLELLTQECDRVGLLVDSESLADATTHAEKSKLVPRTTPTPPASRAASTSTPLSAHTSAIRVSSKPASRFVATRVCESPRMNKKKVEPTFSYGLAYFDDELVEFAFQGATMHADSTQSLALGNIESASLSDTIRADRFRRFFGDHVDEVDSAAPRDSPDADMDPSRVTLALLKEFEKIGVLDPLDGRHVRMRPIEALRDQRQSALSEKSLINSKVDVNLRRGRSGSVYFGSALISLDSNIGDSKYRHRDVGPTNRMLHRRPSLPSLSKASEMHKGKKDAGPTSRLLHRRPSLPSLSKATEMHKGKEDAVPRKMHKARSKITIGDQPRFTSQGKLRVEEEKASQGGANVRRKDTSDQATQVTSVNEDRPDGHTPPIEGICAPKEEQHELARFENENVQEDADEFRDLMKEDVFTTMVETSRRSGGVTSLRWTGDSIATRRVRKRLEASAPPKRQHDTVIPVSPAPLRISRVCSQLRAATSMRNLTKVCHSKMMGHAEECHPEEERHIMTHENKPIEKMRTFGRAVSLAAAARIVQHLSDTTYLDPGSASGSTSGSNSHFGSDAVSDLGSLYLRACQKSKQAPVKRILDSTMEDWTKLSLSEYGLGASGAAPLADLLPLVRWHTLLLQGNGLGSLGAEHLALRLSESCSITHINLCSNCIGPEGGASLLAAVTPGRISKIRLRTLRLGNNSIGDGLSCELQSLLHASPWLLHLDLSCNQLGTRTAHALASCLDTCALTELDLSWNHFISETVDIMAAALTHNDVLTSLNLSWNCVGVRGGRSLGRMLAVNRALTSLQLSHSSIDNRGISDLIEALRDTNRTLTRLDLSDNPLGTCGMENLLNSTVINPVLMHLDLTHSFALGDAIEGAGEEAVRRCDDDSELSENDSSHSEGDSNSSMEGVDNTQDVIVTPRPNSSAMSVRSDSARSSGQNSTVLKTTESRPNSLSMRSRPNSSSMLSRPNSSSKLSRPNSTSAVRSRPSSSSTMRSRLDSSSIRSRPDSSDEQQPDLILTDLSMYLETDTGLDVEFDPQRPDGIYELDLSLAWGRWVACKLRTLALQRKDILRNTCYTPPGRVAGGVGVTAPHDWQQNVPRVGVLRFEYVTLIPEPRSMVYYKLDLSDSLQHEVALLLWQRALIEEGANWADVTLDGEPLAVDETDHLLKWVPPSRGVLTLRYVTLDTMFEAHYKLDLEHETEHSVARMLLDRVRMHTPLDGVSTCRITKAQLDDVELDTSFLESASWRLPHIGLFECDLVAADPCDMVCRSYELDLALDEEWQLADCLRRWALATGDGLVRTKIDGQPVDLERDSGQIIYQFAATEIQREGGGQSKARRCSETWPHRGKLELDYVAQRPKLGLPVDSHEYVLSLPQDRAFVQDFLHMLIFQFSGDCWEMSLAVDHAVQKMSMEDLRDLPKHGELRIKTKGQLSYMSCRVPDEDFSILLRRLGKCSSDWERLQMLRAGSSMDMRTFDADQAEQLAQSFSFVRERAEAIRFLATARQLNASYYSVLVTCIPHGRARDELMIDLMKIEQRARPLHIIDWDFDMERKMPEP